MKIDIWYILGHLCEYVLFLYYSNTCFLPRKNRFQSDLISFLGYVLLFVAGISGKIYISVGLFFVVNILLLVCCYNVKLMSAIFYSLILNVLSCIGEYIVLYLSGLRYTSGWRDTIFTDYQSFAITLYGKLIYLAGIVFLKHFTDKKTIRFDEAQIALAVIPILTIMCLTAMMTMEIDSGVFLMVCVVFVAVNLAAFYINSKMIGKNIKLQILQEEYNKYKAELSEYRILEKKCESTQIMRHDFHKQLDVLQELISSDNEKANEYIKKLKFGQSELNYSKYSDNNILNIILMQKARECHKQNTEIHIHSTYPKLSFISDIDTVAIFSNMLDNAIEASEQSRKKEIFVELYTVNNVYSAVKIENYSDTEPVILDGLPQTQKENSNLHGMGIKSINNALKNYNGEFNWSYDKENKFFRAVALIHIP